MGVIHVKPLLNVFVMLNMDIFKMPMAFPVICSASYALEVTMHPGYVDWRNLKTSTDIALLKMTHTNGYPMI